MKKWLIRLSYDAVILIGVLSSVTWLNNITIWYLGILSVFMVAASTGGYATLKIELSKTFRKWSSGLISYHFLHMAFFVLILASTGHFLLAAAFTWLGAITALIYINMDELKEKSFDESLSEASNSMYSALSRNTDKDLH